MKRVSYSVETKYKTVEMKEAVAKQLINAVTGPDDTNFDINNRGIVVTAKDFHFDTSSKIVTLDVDNNSEKYGILDGGHTYTAIVENVDKLDKTLISM